MPPTSQKTKPGTRKLSELAARLAVPTGITSTGWPAVEKTCVQKLGITFDDWQQGAGRVILAKREDGNLAAMIDGVGLSLPRQVGKTYLVGSMVFALCVNTPGLLVIWSAHHARTHSETFLSMQGFAKRAKVGPHIAQIFTGSGTEEIRFVNGSRILFGARERGFGRGIPGVDVLIFDEAQILSDKALSNMLATMNTSRFGLQLYIGTPPKPDDMSESFTRMRTEALAGTLHDGAWIEFAAEPGAKHDDRAQWRRANPSYPSRTPAQSLQRLKRKLTEEDWLREGMGIWDDAERTKAVIDLSHWATLKDLDAPAPERAALFIDVSPDRKRSSIGIAGSAPGERVLVMVTSGPGTAWVVPEVVRLCEKRDIIEVALQPTSQAGSLIPDLAKAGVEFETLTSTQMGQACAAFIEGVKESRLAHAAQHELDAAVGNARTRFVSEAELWDRRKREVDISPLVAASAAAFRFGQSRSTTSKYEDADMVVV